MRYMKDILIDSRHLTTKVNLYLLINLQNISIVYYINLTNQWCMLLVISLMGKRLIAKWRYRVVIDCERRRVTAYTQDGTRVTFQGDKHDIFP